MKKLTLLGSTGSIGVNVLALASRFPEQFRVVALAAGSNVALLKTQIEAFEPALVAVIDEKAARSLKSLLPPPLRTEILCGPEGYKTVAAHADSDLVVSAIVGAAGLWPTVAAIEAGKDIALANKETLVMGGALVMKLAKDHDVRIMPVDSEHSAIFQCLAGNDPAIVARIILTASGGPFLHVQGPALHRVTAAEAMKHPNWKMGKKITIDSATLMNKGLEVIEARWLFDIAIDRIDVLIHPQSIVHSLVEFTDGAIMAQLGVPDMKIPIAYALSYPNRLAQAGPALKAADLARLDFFPPDLDRFPNLSLAYHAARVCGTMPAVLNAVNEIAVQEFLAGRIGFMDIPAIIESALASHNSLKPTTIHEIIEADNWGRRKAAQLIEKYSSRQQKRANKKGK